MKRLQNRIAESYLTLPIAVVYCCVVWLIAILHNTTAAVHSETLAIHWPEIVCFAVSVYIIVELNNSNILIRVRSRMVASTFIFLSCMLVSGFQSLQAGICQICIITMLQLLFHTYQNNSLPGLTYYAFLCLGGCSLIYVEYLYYIPLLWILMASRLQSLSLRTLLASVFGILTPYWLISIWLFYQNDFTPLAEHLKDFGTFTFPADYLSLSLDQWLVFAFLTVTSIAGIIHFWMYSYEDKIRIRQLYGFLTTMTLITLLFIALQPQFYHLFIRVAIVCSSVLIAHLLTLTSTRFTNIMFFVIIGICICITAVNLWMYFLSF